MSALTLRGAANLVGAVGVIVGAVFAIDQRYVNAGEFKKEIQTVNREITTVKESIVDLHRARIEDEIFKLELIPEIKRTQGEKAMLDRYRSQIKEIDSKRGRR